MKHINLKDLFRGRIMFSRKWVFGLGGSSSNRWTSIERELQVKKRAHDNGRNNLPATADAQPDVVQQQIIDRFGIESDALKQGLWRRLKGAHDLIVERIPQKLELKAIADATKLAVVRIRDRVRHDLIAKRKIEQDRGRDLRRFRAANDLTGRSPAYPQPWPPMKVFFWLVLALVFESLLNGAIFAQASPEYWQGGVVQALAFSFINIVLGFGFLGFVAARYAGHVTPWKRVAGIGGVILVLVAGVAFNMYVAHYREIIERVPLDQIDALSKSSYADAAAHMRAHLFDLTSWQAIVLLLFGLVVFVGLAIEGYHADDAYPAYGRHDRSYHRARRAYEMAQAKVKRAVEKEIDATVSGLKQRIADDAHKVEEAREIFGESQAAEREAADSAADLARACIANLRTYREVNAFVRTDPVPSYFKQYPSFSVDLPEMQVIGARFDDAVQALERNRVAANQIGESLNELSNTELDEFLKFIGEIEHEAARRSAEAELPLAAE